MSRPDKPPRFRRSKARSPPPNGGRASISPRPIGWSRLYGWDDLVFTHISARVPGSDHHFLINPYGMLFEEVTASSLVKIDLHGKKVMESPFEINPAGFVIHSAIHAAREDAHCVMHLHTPPGVAVACQKGGLLPISQQSLFVLASLAYHGYEGVALNDAEKPRLVTDLGDNTFLILPNHGLLTVGGSIADAFLAMYTFAARLRDPGDGAVGRGRTDPDPQNHPRRRHGPAGASHARPRRGARLAGPPAQARPARSGVSGLSRKSWASQRIKPDPFATERRSTLVLPA